MADDIESKLARVQRTLRVTQVIALLGVGLALASYAYGRWAIRRLAHPGSAQRVTVRDASGALELAPGRLILRDAQGRLRVELAAEPAGSHLVLTDRTGHASAQLTAATPTEPGADQTPLSALALGISGEPQALLKPGRLTLSDGQTDRARLGLADTASELDLRSADGKQAALLAARPGTDPAFTLRDDGAAAHLGVTLAGAPALELVDDAKGDGALLAPARLKLGGAGGKEKLVVP